MNGSCGVLILDGSTSKIMGRHNNHFAREAVPKEVLSKAHRGAGYMVVTGERMDKSKKDGNKKTFTGFVIFDILVFNGKHLIGSTFEERQNLLDTLYPTTTYFDKYIDKISDSIYRAKNFKSNFTEIWKDLTSIDMYEGFVLKKPTGKLENGFREANNTGWQIKCRKPTKNYSY